MPEKILSAIAADHLIEDYISCDEKLSFPCLALCRDVHEQLEHTQQHWALVKNENGGNIGVIGLKTLSTLPREVRNKNISGFLEKITDICTPGCNARSVAKRLFEANHPYVLVVNSSGQLLSFLELSDFRATTRH